MHPQPSTHQDTLDSTVAQMLKSYTWDTSTPQILRTEHTQIQITPQQTQGVHPCYSVTVKSGRDSSDPLTTQQLFVKIMPDDYWHDLRLKGLLIAESTQSNTHILEEFRTVNGKRALVSRYLDGKTLADIAAQDQQRAVDIITQSVIPTLSQFHSSGKSYNLARELNGETPQPFPFPDDVKKRTNFTFFQPDYDTNARIRLIHTFGYQDTAFAKQLLDYNYNSSYARTLKKQPPTLLTDFAPYTHTGQSIAKLITNVTVLYETLVADKLEEINKHPRTRSGQDSIYKVLAVNDLKSNNIMIEENEFSKPSTRIIDTKKTRPNNLFVDLSRMLYDRRLQLNDQQRQAIIDTYIGNWIHYIETTNTPHERSYQTPQAIEETIYHMEKLMGRLLNENRPKDLERAQPKYATTWRQEFSNLIYITLIDEELKYLSEYAINIIHNTLPHQTEKTIQGLHNHLTTFAQGIDYLTKNLPKEAASWHALGEAVKELYGTENIQYLATQNITPTFPMQDAKTQQTFFYWPSI